ncbi:MAG: AAA family ATPase [Pseudomonadota bacterium]
MITVKSIHIKEFRGIRNLKIELAEKNFAVCGPNGTGKSGIVDALEFALTGNISRLSGSGTGKLSVKEHGPHVDSRNRAKDAAVTLSLYIPSLKKDATITRSVHDAKKPIILPDDVEIKSVLAKVALHPEFVLSRRELIKYVLAEPSNRSKEVQALLRLEEVDSVRALLVKIFNTSQRKLEYCNKSKVLSTDNLLRGVNIPKLSVVALLNAVNEKRSLLSLPALSEINSTTSVKDGVSSALANQATNKVVKMTAVEQLNSLGALLNSFESGELKQELSDIEKSLNEFLNNEKYIKYATKEEFLKTALAEFDGESCPVCETVWDPVEFKRQINDKLKLYKSMSEDKRKVEAKINPIIGNIHQLYSFLDKISKYGLSLNANIDIQVITSHIKVLVNTESSLKKFFPLTETISSIKDFQILPAPVKAALAQISALVVALPEPSQQDSARDFLIVAQERLEAYQQASRDVRDAEQEASIAQKVLDKYGSIITTALEDIYKSVEGTFSDLYRIINHDDEADFKAKLQPSLGKLGFDVDFYGRGFFPPGAYHSEGHQDGMGLCLYLALMKHLAGESFTFAVLDDVLMSVDSGHRREVSQMLKSQFPNTQFLFTTHDDIWLRHMKTVGLIQPKNFAHFRTWSVDVGPAEWNGRDVWDEINEYLKSNRVREAAALLRHYLEYFAKEACNSLRAPVEFRGDAQYTLGDLLPNAFSRLSKLLRDSKSVAQSWKDNEATSRAEIIENELGEINKIIQIDQWQVNSAVHYNEWATLNSNDFRPLADAYKNLVYRFSCSKCNGAIFATPTSGKLAALRCPCGSLNLNLLKK